MRYEEFNNRWPMGHIAHLKNQFKINTFSLRYDYIKTLIFKFCQWIFAISLLSPLGKGHGPSFKKTWIPFTQWYFVLWLVEIGPVVLEKIFKFCQCIFAILKLSPLRKRHVLSFEKNLNCHHPRLFCAKFG